MQREQEGTETGADNKKNHLFVQETRYVLVVCATGFGLSGLNDWKHSVLYTYAYPPKRVGAKRRYLSACPLCFLPVLALICIDTK